MLEALGLILAMIGVLFAFETPRRWFIAFFKEPVSVRSQQRRRDLFRGLSDPVYLQWQQEVLEMLYQGLEIATLYGRKYPAGIIRPRPGWQYPFTGLCRLAEIRPSTLDLSAEQKSYVRMLGGSLRWPRMKGFALRRIYLDDEARADVIEATATTFLHNVATAHILEWELYELYAKRTSKKWVSADPEILRCLPMRARYHDYRPGRVAVLKPAAAYPLISLQAIVIFRDTRITSNPTWRVVTARRSNEVIVRRGFFQFQPARGFEVYGTESDDDDYLVHQGFDVTTALFREFAEELYDAKHLQVRPDSRDPTSVLSDPNVQHLIALIDSKKAFVDYLGVVIDLPMLRHDLSFLIVIDDEGFCRNSLLGSWEAKNIVGIPPRELRSLLSQEALHGSSAALLQLAIESDRLRETGVSIDLG